LIHSRDTLLNQLPTSAHKVALEFLVKHKVRVMLSTRVTDCHFKNGSYKIVTDSGDIVHADRLYSCVGFIPNTEFMNTNFKHALTDKGLVKVDSTMLVEGTKNIWAIGDVVNLNEPKMAVTAEKHSEYLQKQLSKIAAGEQLSNYKPQDPEPSAMLVTLGPDKAIFVMCKKLISTGTIAVSMKNWVETKLVSDFGQTKEILGTHGDYTKTLKLALKHAEGEEDMDPEEIEKLREAVDNEAVFIDIFHGIKA